jgi:hypothetical protein
VTAFSDIDGPSLLRKIGWSARCEVLFYYGGQEATHPTSLARSSSPNGARSAPIHI